MAELSEAALEARRAYQREWGARNKDKIKAKNARYWEKRATMKKGQTEKETQENEREAGL